MTIHRPLLRLACVVHVLATGSAWAQSSPYYLGVAQSLGYESNLYRLGDNQVLPDGLSRSDTVSGTSLVAGVDQTIGRQRVYGSANLRANRYSNNRSLNNDSYGMNLAMDWETVDKVSGTLILAADQNLAQFDRRNASGPVETKKNVQRTLSVDSKVRLGLVGLYSLEATLGRRERAYSAAEYDASEYHQNMASLGLRWRPSAYLQLGAALRGTQATYPRFRQVDVGTFEADHLTRQDIDFTAYWQPSGLSQINARISPTRTRYRRDTGSDFSGITGSASWAWQATGKLKLTTQASRDTGQSSDAVNRGIFGNGVSDYGRTSTSLSTRGAFDFSAKIGLTAGLTYTHRALTNTFTLQGLGPTQRVGGDNTTSLALGARWIPTRAIQTGCDLTAERRTASNLQLSVPLSGNSFSCYGQFILQ
ncbi:MAG: hypothetical protein CFE45_16885 [Burkholderiales bacterium PBB5]|nr:MAG: hypothetical protein CFE45_16885 [Burkholderiales bacterium PBB5]